MRAAYFKEYQRLDFQVKGIFTVSREIQQGAVRRAGGAR
jgi:hypothetical protein